MAAQAWKVYAAAKKKIGQGTLTLGAGVFKMSLHKSSASTNIKALSSKSIFSQIGSEIAVAGGYVAGGKTIQPATGKWTTGASAKELKFTFTTAGLVFTASGANLSAIRYALLHKSAGSTTSGPLLCFASLSSAAFSVTSPNTLTVIPASQGLFTLA